MLKVSGDKNETQRAVALMTAHAAVLLFVVSVGRELFAAHQWGLLLVLAGEAVLAGIGMLNSYIALSHAGSDEESGRALYKRWESSSRDGLAMTIVYGAIGVAVFAAGVLLGWITFPAT